MAIFMTLFPRPPRQLRAMPAEAFPDDVILRPSLYPLTDQGGANPVPCNDFTFKASVQRVTRRSADVPLGGGSMPQSFTQYDVLIPYSENLIVRSLRIGDEVVYRDLVLSVQAPADDYGLKTVLHIKCELVTL